MKYNYNSIADIAAFSERDGIPFWQVVLRSEVELTEADEAAVLGEAKKRIAIFNQSVEDGLADTRTTPSGMSGGQAKALFDGQPRFLSPLAYKALTYAIAVNEANAKMFRIVACPTAGSCGVVPGVMRAVGDTYHLDEEAYVRGFFAAAGVGNVITNAACVAGAVGGCQAEVGVAASMAASAAVELMGGAPKQCLYAASTVLMNMLGLVCDPVGGLVECPCQGRNAAGAANALTAAELALSGIQQPIPFDEMLDAMYTVGKRLPSEYRETAKGGCAATPTGCSLCSLNVE